MQKPITADKDPNFLNNLERRSHVVAPCDTLDHVVRVAVVASNAPEHVMVLDHATGKNTQERNTFVHPVPLSKENGFCPQTERNVKPKKRTITNRKGTEIEVEQPYHYNVVTGEREYRDLRPPARRIASDAHGNPLTFATKPGEVRASKIAPRSTIADFEDYGEDMAAEYEAAILRTRK